MILAVLAFDKIADSLQVTAASASNTTFNEDFNLFILYENKKKEVIVDKLVKEFDVERKKCGRDVGTFLQQMKRKKLVEVKNGSRR